METVQNTNLIEKKERKFQSRATKRLLFYILIMFLPTLQFCIFYIYINANSFILAFSNYKSLTAKPTFAGIENFKTALQVIGRSGFMFKNAIIYYFLSFFFGLGSAIIFSYYIAKKHFASGFFKTILFLPQIVSGLVLCILYMYIVEDVYVTIAGQFLSEPPTGGLLSTPNPTTQYWTVAIYSVFISFGSNVLLISGAMSGIDESIIESAHLDGVNTVQEFIHITFPMIYPTFITFFVAQLAGIFTNSMHLYTFFQGGAGELSTMGYYLYVQALHSAVYTTGNTLSYPELSALGLTLTSMVLPLTLISRKLLTKFGPSVD